MRAQVHTVDVEQRTDRVRRLGDRGQVRPAAEQVGRPGQRDQPGPLVELLAVRARRSARVARHRSRSSARDTGLLAAISTQGRTLASWSSRLTAISSPAVQVLAIARAMSKVSWVMLRPNTMPAGSAPSRSAIADRADATTASAPCSARVTVPRLAIGEISVSCTARATEAGVCEPPGPSKWAAPAASAGNWARMAATSRLGWVSCGHELQLTPLREVSQARPPTPESPSYGSSWWSGWRPAARTRWPATPRRRSGPAPRRSSRPSGWRSGRRARCRHRQR